jgi:hypothetical protein
MVPSMNATVPAGRVGSTPRCDLVTNGSGQVPGGSRTWMSTSASRIEAVMNKVLVAVFGVLLALTSCGSDGGSSDSGATQSELADLLVEQAQGVGLDEECIRDKTAELSEQDAQFLIDNIDSTDTEGFSSELQTWIDGLIECLDDSETTETSVAADDEVSSTEATDDTDVAGDTDAEGDSDGVASDELVSIGKSGFSTWTNSSGETWASAAALVTNETDQDLFGTEVTFNFIGADGTPVTTESTFLEVIPAGDSFPTQIQTYTDLTAVMPITVEITAFAEPDSFFETEWVELELGPTTITSDEYFSTVSGTVTNPADQPFDFYRIDCLIVTADGDVVGGALTYPDQVAPGQQIAWEASVEDGPIQAGGVAAECRSIATIS